MAMEGTIEPASTIPGDSLREYLRSQGMSPEIIEWKYFDAEFNRGRERDYAWVCDGQVCAFLGLVPFTLGQGDQSWDSMWLCDWTRKPGGSARGIGRRLAIEAAESFDHGVGFGGTATPQYLHPQIADRTIVDAGIVFRLPLRLGAILSKLSRRRPFAAVSRWRRLGRIPLFTLPRRSVGHSVRIEPGVARAIGPLVQRNHGKRWFPRYDLAYLEWQLVRCPDVICWTCYVPAESGAVAPALIWRPVNSTDSWRLALWWQEGAREELAAVLTEAIHHAHNDNALIVWLIASRLDADLIALAKSKHFRPSSQRMPLSIYTRRSTSQAIDEVARLSYLDGDLAYRF